MQKNNKIRCSAYISTANYKRISEIMKDKTLINMKLSKGALIDIALTHLFKDLINGDINQFAIEHLKFIGDDIDGI